MKLIKIFFTLFSILFIIPLISEARGGRGFLDFGQNPSFYIIKNVPSTIPDPIISDKINADSGSKTIFSSRSDMSCEETLRSPGTLEERLSPCVYINQNVVWQNPDGRFVGYLNWSREQKDRLNEIFDRLMRNEADLQIRCPSSDSPVNFRSRFLTPQQAFDVYAAHVAHVFYLEATRAVPWSILEMSPADQTELLASSRYHSRIVPPTRGMAADISPFIANQDFQQLEERSIDHSLICDPRVGYRFVRGLTSTGRNNLLGSTQEQTLMNLTLWAMRNFAGHLATSSPTHTEETLPQLNRLGYLENRLRPVTRNEPQSRTGIIRYIPSYYGCHTAANILHDLARSVNIPLIISYSSARNPETLLQLLRDRSGVDHHINEVVHAGLVFQPNSDHPMVLYSADELANNTVPALFVHSGTAGVVSESELAEYIYHTLWFSPGEWSVKGMYVFPSFSEIISGRGYGIHNVAPNGYGDYLPSYGHFSGYFRDTGYTLLNQSSSNYFISYIYSSKYRLCTWSNFAQNSCELSRDFFIRQISGELPISDRSAMDVINSLDDFYRQASFCVMARGGCDGSRAFISDWLADTLGSNVGVGD